MADICGNTLATVDITVGSYHSYKQRQLNLIISRAIEEELIHIPGIRADCFRVANAVGVLLLRCFQSDKVFELVCILRRAVLPVRLNRLPEFA